MSKINTTLRAFSALSAPLKTVAGSKTTYREPARYISDSKTEAFRLGVTLFGGNEPTYYEKGKGRDDRFNQLMESLAVEDQVWVMGFLPWLRSEANIRTASIMGACHAVHARLNDAESVKFDGTVGYTGAGINRTIIDRVCQRADEPGELAAYWTATFGAMPKCVKRGLADAANRLYSEYSVMKYDTSSHAFRFADVLNLTHAKPKFVYKDWELEKAQEAYEDVMFFANGNMNKADLFKHIIDRRFGNEATVTLPMIAANMSVRAIAKDNVDILLNQAAVKEAGLTWEDVLSLGGSKLDKAKLWEAVIPSMGYMALLRNLRNFEEAGISKDSKNHVIKILTDEKQVAKSRQFPFRFLSASNAVNSLDYQRSLEKALDYSVRNIPELDGGTLVLVDTSGSMDAKVSGYSKMSRAGIAALFGAALANRNAGNVDLVMFASYSAPVNVPRGGSVLAMVKEIDSRNGQVGHGTQTAEAVKKNFDPKRHKRVMVFTDGKSFGGYHGQGIGSLVPDKTFMYAFDLAGYQTTDLKTGGRRYQLAGLTDATFKQISYLENGEEANWPWIQKPEGR